MKMILLFLSLMISVAASAQESRLKRPQVVPDLHQLELYPLALDIRYEKDAAQNYVEQKPLNVSFAYRQNAWSVLFEYSKFNEESGNPTLNINRKHEEVVLWGRWHLWRLSKNAMRVTVYGGGGLGTYTEDVTTTLSGNAQTDTTGAKFMGGLSAGADISYNFNKSFGVIAAAEGRGLMGQDFDPNPMFGFVGRGGAFYAW